MGQKKKDDGIPLIYSIRFKILLLVLVAIIAVTCSCMNLTMPKVRDSLTTLTKSYMNDVTLVAGENIDNAIEFNDIEHILTSENLEHMVGDICVEGMSSSYAYVVSPEGIMLYHPAAEKIGQPVENDAVKQLLAEMEKGNRPKTDVITYLFNGANKYASYYIGENMNFIVIVTADEEEAFECVDEIMLHSSIGAVAALIICGLSALLIAGRIVRPISKISVLVSKLSRLDFKEDAGMAAFMKRRDETGVMARAVDDLQKQLIDVVKGMKKQSESIFEASMAMNSSAQETSQSVEQVERAVAEIADGATSQAHETQSATENVILMGNMIEETNREVENLRSNARIMRNSGDEALEILQELTQINQKTKSAIQVISGQTKQTNDSALAIKKATELITNIAEETSLLSLNASIEAARAGDQGRGFAVVADQIQKLANQSTESAKQIEEIINLLIEASDKTVETMTEVNEVVEKQDADVARTTEAFQHVKEGIDKSIEGIRSISDKTRQLDDTRGKVVDVVQSLTAIAQQNAASTEETSASVTEVGEIMINVSDDAKNLNQIANDLENSVKLFTID